MPCVLHVDADAYFCQVEALRNPDLRGRPLAVYQQYDVISVDHAARALGVRKHMPVALAREALERAGGRLVHVFCEGGSRASYRPYREASGALMRLLRRFPAVAACEKASIDEAFLLLRAPPPPSPPDGGGRGTAAAAGHGGGAAAAGGGNGSGEGGGGGGGGGDDDDLARGAELAAAIRAASRAELGLVLSVGVARNKLLAKLASRAAKPDGVMVLGSPAEVARALEQTPASRLPGMGGAVAAALARAGIAAASELGRLTPEELAARVGSAGAGSGSGGASSGVASRFGLPDGSGGGSVAASAGTYALTPAVAARLVAWGRGECNAAVVERGPSKSIQSQLTLTWSNLAHHSGLPQAAAAVGDGNGGGGGGGGSGSGNRSGSGSGSGGPRWTAPPPWLAPLLTGRPDTLPRLRAIAGALHADLAARVVLDRHTEDRWPAKLGVRLALAAPGEQTFRSASKSVPFPPAALLLQQEPQEHQDHHHQQQQQQEQEQWQQRDQPGDSPGNASKGVPAAAPVVPVAAAVSERAWHVPAALSAAIVDAVAAAAAKLLAGVAPGSVVGAVTLAAAGFEPFGSARNADISAFFPPRAQLQPQPQPHPAVAAADGSRASGMMEQDAPAAAAAAAGAGQTGIEQQAKQQQRQQEHGQQRGQQHVRPPAAKLRQAPLPIIYNGLTARAAAAPPPAAAPGAPKLSDVLAALASQSGREARAALDGALTAAGLRPLILGGGGGGSSGSFSSSSDEVCSDSGGCELVAS